MIKDSEKSSIHIPLVTRRGKRLDGSPPPELRQVAEKVGRERILSALGIIYEQARWLGKWLEDFGEAVRRRAERFDSTIRQIKMPCSGCGSCNWGKWRVHPYFQVYDSVRGDYAHIPVYEEKNFLVRFVPERDYDIYVYVKETVLTLLFLYNWFRNLEVFVGVLSEEDFK